MATRVPVANPVAIELPKEEIGKVHRRVVVAVTGSGGKKENISIRAYFDEMLKKNIDALRNPEKPAMIDLFADLFVNHVKEEYGWHSQVIGIAKSLENNPGDNVMRELGKAIKYHAEQLWAMRHVDDSKRSG